MPTQTVETAFTLGETVYLKTDVMQIPRQVVRVMFESGWVASYVVSYICGATVVNSTHTVLELSSKEDRTLRRRFSSTDLPGEIEEAGE